MTLRPLLALPSIALALAACGDDSATTGATTDTTTADATAADTATAATDAVTTPDVSDARASCDPLGPNTCGADKTCSYLANETSATCLAAGVVPPNQPCGGENRCQSGVCLALNGTASLCYQFCDANEDCGAAGTCLDLSNTPFDICKIEGIYDNCDLLAQDCTDAAKSCYAVASEPDPICLTTGTKKLTEACDKASDCERGLACVNDACRTLCDPAADPDPCGETFQCNELFANAGYCDPK